MLEIDHRCEASRNRHLLSRDGYAPERQRGNYPGPKFLCGHLGPRVFYLGRTVRHKDDVVRIPDEAEFRNALVVGMEDDCVRCLRFTHFWETWSWFRAARRIQRLVTCPSRRSINAAVYEREVRWTRELAEKSGDQNTLRSCSDPDHIQTVAELDRRK